jgi:hypothetical protein
MLFLESQLIEACVQSNQVAQGEWPIRTIGGEGQPGPIVAGKKNAALFRTTTGRKTALLRANINISFL